MKKTAKKMGKVLCMAALAAALGACGQKETAAPEESQAVESQAAESESEETAEETEEKETGEPEGESKTDASEEADEAASDDETASGDEADSSEAAEESVSSDEQEEAQEPSAGEESQAAQDVSAAEGEAEAAAMTVSDIYSQITQSVSLNAPMIAPDDFIVNYYGIDVKALDEYVFSMSEAATSAETVVILKAKNEADTGALSAALQVVIDERRAEMENYLPDQFQIVDKSSVQTRGKYVYLVISEQAGSIQPIIEAGIQ